MSRETAHLRREILHSTDPLRHHSLNNQTLREGIVSLRELRPSKSVKRSMRRKAKEEADRLSYQVHEQAKIERILARVRAVIYNTYDGYDPDVFRDEMRFLRHLGVQLPRSH